MRVARIFPARTCGTHDKSPRLRHPASQWSSSRLNFWIVWRSHRCSRIHWPRQWGYSFDRVLWTCWGTPLTRRRRSSFGWTPLRPPWSRRERPWRIWRAGKLRCGWYRTKHRRILAQQQIAQHRLSILIANILWQSCYKVSNRPLYLRSSCELPSYSRRGSRISSCQLGSRRRFRPWVNSLHRQ